MSTVIDVKTRLAEIQEQQRLSGELLGWMRVPDEPPGWREKYIIHPGETPWWEVRGRKERRKAYHLQHMRMWYRVHPGAQTEADRKFHKEHPGYFAEAAREWRKRHPEVCAESHRKFEENHPGYHTEVFRRYYKTLKGKTNLFKKAAARREYSTDPALYAARVYMLHDLRESCAICGALYDTTHQVDHILALCLGGIDSWDNYQPLCLICHRKKTTEDLRKYREMIKEGREV